MDPQNLPPPAPATPAPAAPFRQTSALAITSLIAGVLGWTLLPWLGSLVAVITGHLARAEIRRSPDTLEGDGLAIAGLVLGWVMIALSVLTILAVILFFGGLAVLLGFLGISGQL
ncbi:DUF4190 domain-containing protein [Arenimonas daejeonensis]|uniref:DUF4190 domain-containing protein n=1 Tax=Arenimonas daejeonensis TaxID=370777 RepID=UPI0011BF63CD|nr:DUF4190 domain-containing protein [Arenimonas daejeonensis]